MGMLIVCLLLLSVFCTAWIVAVSTKPDELSPKPVRAHYEKARRR